jgi:hypothetical protein
LGIKFVAEEKQMHIDALVIGILVAVLLVFKSRNWTEKKWAYPALLASFPAYYWVFALYAADDVALRHELAVSIIFLAIAFVAYRVKSVASMLLLAIGFIGHAAYDVYHDMLFINTGGPKWWPEFCGAVDILVGCYLVYLAFLLRRRQVLALES